VPNRTALETVGVLLIAVRQPRVITDQEMAIMSSLAEMAGAALHPRRLHEETARRVSHLQARQTLDRAIAGSRDLHLTLGILLDQVMALLGFDAVGVLLMNARAGHLAPAAGRGFRGRGYFEGRLRLKEGNGVEGFGSIFCRRWRARARWPSTGPSCSRRCSGPASNCVVMMAMIGVGMFDAN